MPLWDAASRASPTARLSGVDVSGNVDVCDGDRYTRWANELTPAELWTHRYRECTLIQPTWFISRATFDSVGGYWEEMAEDLQVTVLHDC